MEHVIDETRPIFVQIAERIEEDILTGGLAEEEQVPSTNQFAALYQINPATAAKGVNLLVDQGILYKRRGLRMYVAPGARARLLEKRANCSSSNTLRRCSRRLKSLASQPIRWWS